MAATLPTDTQPQDTLLQQQDATKKTGRRQWSIQGGPRGLLRRMRSQLAEDGCPESQLIMGKTLLEQQGSEEEEESARLAVFWLTRASLQGNCEATALLQDCLDNNIGICEHNYHEVRECLAMDLQEKLARRAAHMLFCSLSDGNDVISSSGLTNKIHEILACEEMEAKETEADDCQQNHKHPESHTNLEERYGGERFTEEHIVSASVLYCQGRVPPLHHFLTLISPMPPRSCLLQALHWPQRLLEEICENCVHFLGVTLTNYVGRILRMLTPVTVGIIICLLAGFLSFFQAEHVAIILPVIMSFVSLIVMLVSSVHLILNRKRFNCFHTWTVVFSHFCPELDVVQAEGRFKARCWKPYAAMSLAIFLYLSTVPLTSPRLMLIFLPVMWISAISTFLLVPEKLTKWQFFSIFLYISAITPSIYGNIGHWLVSVTTGTGLEHILAENHIDVWWGIRLHLGIGPLLHLLWFGLQLSVLVSSGPSYLPSHLVSVVWYHLAVVASHKVATPIDILYPIAGWSLMVLLPTVSSFVLLVGPAFVCACLGLHIGMDYQSLVLIFFCSMCLMWIMKNWWPNLIFVCKLIVVMGMLLTFFQPSSFVKSPASRHSSLQWDNFKNVCLPSKDSRAITVHGCLPLQGTVVKWQGSVVQVNIISVYNLPQMLISVLPVALERPLRCYLGQKLSPCPKSKVVTTQNERCKLLHNVLGSDMCTLETWNEYTFDIKIAMSSSYWKFGSEGSQVILTADSTFQDFMLGVDIGAQVEFVGALFEGIGSHEPKLHISSIKCINCKSKLNPVHKGDYQFKTDIKAVPPYIFNFFLGPTLTI